MTDLPDEADDRHVANDPDPAAGPPHPTPAPRVTLVWGAHGPVAPDASPASGPAPATSGFVAGWPVSVSPASGHVPPAALPPPALPAPSGGSRTGLAVVVAIGLAAVLGVGVVIGLSVSGGSSTEAVTTPVPTAPSRVPTTAPPSAPPGEYSMSAITNACDLVDPMPLTKWSSTPTAPVHREDPPSDGYGGSLLCTLRYTSTSPVDGVTTDEAGIGVTVEFTSAGEPPGYDRWNNVGTAQPGWSTGTVPGLGTRNHWRGIAVTDPGPAASYIVAVQDSNVSVEVQVAVHRAPGDGPPALDDLSAIGLSHARSVLDRLKRP